MQTALEIVSHRICHFNFFFFFSAVLFDTWLLFIYFTKIHIEVLKILESHHPNALKYGFIFIYLQ